VSQKFESEGYTITHPETGIRRIATNRNIKNCRKLGYISMYKKKWKRSVKMYKKE
jgi:hypothetical protein